MEVESSYARNEIEVIIDTLPLSLPSLKLQIQQLKILTKPNSDSSVSQPQQLISDDLKQINYILNYLLRFPSVKLAQIHRDSNRLGHTDCKELKSLKKGNGGEEQEENSQHNPIQQNVPYHPYKIDEQLCSCCGFIYQRESLSCQEGISDVRNIGEETNHFFKMIWIIILLLGIMTITYSSYSIVSNIQSYLEALTKGNMTTVDPVTNTTLRTDGSLFELLSISLGSTQLNNSSAQRDDLYVMQVWLGCLMILGWGVAFFLLKYWESPPENEGKSVSDYSVVVENMPTGIDRTSLEQQLNQYGDFSLKRYNEGKPFYFNETEFSCENFKQLLKQEQQFKRMFIKWITERKSTDSFLPHAQFRFTQYKAYNSVLKMKNQRCWTIMEKIKEKYSKKNKVHKTTAFLTFENTLQRNEFLRMNTVSTIEKILPCWRKGYRFIVKGGGSGGSGEEKNGERTNEIKQMNEVNIFNDIPRTNTIVSEAMTFRGQRPPQAVACHSVRIYEAPEAEDIVWSNIGVKRCQKLSRRLVTFTFTGILLVGTFIGVYWLTSLKYSNPNPLLSVVVSSLIAIVNLLISQTIQGLTKYERDYTMTNYQISLAYKGVAAQLLNTILTPLAANYFINQNIYGGGGLVYDIFVLGLTNSILPPLARFLDVPSLFSLLSAWYYRDPIRRLSLTQYQLNSIYEYPQFEVGYEYIYIITLYLFCCFFVPLQPVIPIVGIIGLSIMYMAHKHVLFNRAQRPVPGTPIIHKAINQVVYCGAAFYAVGSFLWSKFLPQRLFDLSIIPNIIASTLGFIIILSPFQLIQSCKASETEKREAEGKSGAEKEKKSESKHGYKHGDNKQISSYPQSNTTTSPLINPPNHSYEQNRLFFTAEYDRLNPSTSEQAIAEYLSYIQEQKIKFNTEPEEIQLKITTELNRQGRINFHKNNTLFLSPFSSSQENNLVRDLILQQSKNTTNPLMVAELFKNYRRKHRRKYKNTVQRTITLEDGSRVEQENETSPSNYFKNIAAVQSYIVKDNTFEPQMERIEEEIQEEIQETKKKVPSIEGIESAEPDELILFSTLKFIDSNIYSKQSLNLDSLSNVYASKIILEEAEEQEMVVCVV